MKYMMVSLPWGTSITGSWLPWGTATTTQGCNLHLQWHVMLNCKEITFTSNRDE
jgi:hypothetical protein